MPFDKPADSSFILKCLEFVYKDDPTVLRNKTLKGLPESVTYNDDGSTVTQPKKELSKCQIDSVSFGERIKDANVNKLFATGILNIAKKKQ